MSILKEFYKSQFPIVIINILITNSFYNNIKNNFSLRIFLVKPSIRTVQKIVAYCRNFIFNIFFMWDQYGVLIMILQIVSLV